MTNQTLKIERQETGDKTVLILAGELNTITSNDLQAELDKTCCNELVFDFNNVTYITSAGIRILLYSKQNMLEKHGIMYVININDEVKETLEMVGLYNQFIKND